MSKTDLSAVLKAVKCQCGSEKKPGDPFCYDCFKSLPPLYQKALYKVMGNGYEEAYGAAVRYLGVLQGRETGRA